MSTWHWSYFTLLVVVLTGSQALAASRPLVVLVRDAETNTPIGRADVRTSYSATMMLSSPRDSSDTTKADGIARLEMGAGDDFGVVLLASAPGYLDGEKTVSTEVIRAIKPLGLFEVVRRRPVNVVVELYKQPYPAAELVVPAGFRGMIEAKLGGGKAVWAVGQRAVRFAVPASGKVEVSGPTWLPHEQAPEFRVSFADGTPVTPRAQQSQLGYWWIKSKGTLNYVLVGTQHDYDACGLFAHPDADETGSSAVGGRSGSRGRRGRRGGQQSGNMD